MQEKISPLRGKFYVEVIELLLNEYESIYVTLNKSTKMKVQLNFMGLFFITFYQICVNNDY